MEAASSKHRTHRRRLLARIGRLGIAVSLAAASASASFAAGTRTVLNLVTAGAPTSAQVQAAERFARHLLAVSGGRMAARIEHRSGTLMGLWQGVGVGAIDLHVADIGALVVLPQARMLNVLWTPFLFRDQDHYRRFIRSAEFTQLADSVRQATGIRFVGQVGDKAPRVITNNRQPVRTVRDLEGLRFPVAPNPIFIRTYELWGAIPEPMNALQFHMALAGSTVDGQDNGLLDFVRAKVLVKTHKHFSAVNWIHSGIGIWVSDAAWNRLSAEQRRWLKDTVQEAAAEGETIFAAEMARALERLPELGIKVTTPELDSFRFVKTRIVAELEGQQWPSGLVARIDAMGLPIQVSSQESSESSK
ncbi:MAG: TRAP transporter substrate-binding protein [Burkholderiaceae bacterium]